MESLLCNCGLLYNGDGDLKGAQTVRRFGAGPVGSLLGRKDPTGRLSILDFRFWIVGRDKRLLGRYLDSPVPSAAKSFCMISEPIKADSNGAVTLPAELCRAAGLAPGADLVAEVDVGRIVVQPAGPSLAERIVARAAALPPEALDSLPADGASQHDHYIYGTPKRPG